MASANASIDSISKLLVGSSYRDGETERGRDREGERQRGGDRETERGRDREGETKSENLHNQQVFRMIKLLRI